MPLGPLLSIRKEGGAEGWSYHLNGWNVILLDLLLDFFFLVYHYLTISAVKILLFEDISVRNLYFLRPMQTNGEDQCKFLVDYMETRTKGVFYDLKIVSDFAGIQRFVTGFRARWVVSILTNRLGLFFFVEESYLELMFPEKVFVVLLIELAYSLVTVLFGSSNHIRFCVAIICNTSGLNKIGTNDFIFSRAF